MKLDELYEALIEMLKRGVSPDALRAELESAIRLHERYLSTMR